MPSGNIIVPLIELLDNSMSIQEAIKECHNEVFHLKKNLRLSFYSADCEEQFFDDCTRIQRELKKVLIREDIRERQPMTIDEISKELLSMHEKCKQIDIATTKIYDMLQDLSEDIEDMFECSRDYKIVKGKINEIQRKLEDI